jgi:hypothetical protein
MSALSYLEGTLSSKLRLNIELIDAITKRVTSDDRICELLWDNLQPDCSLQRSINSLEYVWCDIARGTRLANS